MFKSNKEFAVFIFIFSLIPGDTFYGRIGIAQSYFLVPLFILYLFSVSKLPKISVLKTAGLSMLAILSIQLLVYKFEGIIEWYRSSGGIMATFIIVVLFSCQDNNEKLIKWVALATIVPVASFYLGFWDMGNVNNPRATFLYHDPNHLGQFLLYGIISLLYLSKDYKKKLHKLGITLLIVAFIIPILYTFSRTVVILFAMLLITFMLTISNISGLIKKTIIASLLILIFFSMFPNKRIFENRMFQVFQVRFVEEDQTRINYYSTGLQLIGENFLFGVGIRNYVNPDWRVKNGFSRRDIGTQHTYEVATSTHNGLIDVFLIGGIGLFISFCIIITYPAIYLFTFSKKHRDKDLKYEKLLILSFLLTFITINMTYSLYHSKIGWFGVAYSYLIIYPYYRASKTLTKKAIPLKNISQSLTQLQFDNIPEIHQQ